MRAAIRNMALMGIGVAFAAVSAHAGEWRQLGVKVVDYRSNPVVIMTNAGAGAASKVKLQVSQQELEIRSVSFTFAGGESATVEMNRYVPAGGSTPAIEVPGGSKTIEKIEVSFAPGTPKEKLPVVAVLGES